MSIILIPVLWISSAIIAIYVYTSVPAVIGEIPFTPLHGSFSFSQLLDLLPYMLVDPNSTTDVTIPLFLTPIVGLCGHTWLPWLFASLLVLAGVASLGGAMGCAGCAVILGAGGGAIYSLAAALIIWSLASQTPLVSPTFAILAFPALFSASLAAVARVPSDIDESSQD
jgi:hypothetical protein